MLTDFSFSNYRAFKRGAINLKPLTIFIGANSLGKTAILQLPLLAKQTASITESRFRGALRIHGREVTFGRPGKLFHNMDSSKNLELEYGFEDTNLREYLSENISRTFIDSLQSLFRFAYLVSTETKTIPGPINAQVNSYTKILKKYLTDSSPRRRHIDPSTIENLIEGIEPAVFLIKNIGSDSREANLYVGLLHRSFDEALERFGNRPISSSLSHADLERGLRYCIALQKLTSSRFSVRFSFNLVKDNNGDAGIGSDNLRMNISSAAFKAGGRNIFKIDFAEDQINKISSDLIESKYLNHSFATLSKFFNVSGNIFNFIEEDPFNRFRFGANEILRNVCSKMVSALQMAVGGNAIEHIGPLRAHPKRFYFLDQNYGYQSGETIVEKLRQDPDLVDKVNGWLKKFDVKIAVSQLVEIISRLSIRRNNASFDLDITDVGFGISQFLPILVEGLLAPNGRCLVIEQPEIHLHPKMQAELADFLLDVANIRVKGSSERTETRTLLVETHSEYLLNRIKARIAQGEISHSDVAIYYVEPSSDGNGSTVRGISVPVDGGFEWPKEFYEADLMDSLAALTPVRKTSAGK